jgi:uncharacterized membrane protein YedE/YeeE
LGGFLVGVGTKMANGCTSGHGIFGLAQLSRRSMIAVLCFITSAMCMATLRGNFTFLDNGSEVGSTFY